MFDDYLKASEKKANASVVEFVFRNKKSLNGKTNSRTSFIRFADGKEYVKTIANDEFLNAYYSRLIYRESCGSCPYAMSERVGDLTLADAWGIDKIDKECNPLEGVSLLLVNSKKGLLVFNCIRDSLDAKPLDFDFAVQSNEQLSKPTLFNKKREKFFIYWKKYGFNKAVRKTIGPSLLKRIIKKALRRI